MVCMKKHLIIFLLLRQSLVYVVWCYKLLYITLVAFYIYGHTYKISELRKRLMVRYEEAINNILLSVQTARLVHCSKLISAQTARLVLSFSANSSAGTLVHCSKLVSAQTTRLVLSFNANSSAGTL
jgi:hypothetical protein